MRVATLLSYRAHANELKKVERNAEFAQQLRRNESWAVDPRWYRSCLEPYLAAVLGTIEEYLPAHMKESPVCLNLFDLVPLGACVDETDNSKFDRFEIS